MTKRILHVDLSKDARDFVGTASGDLPLLDASNANDRKLRGTLGRLAAQSERHKDKDRKDIVDFYVCDDTAGRPADVVCEPVSERDLRNNSDLRNDLDLLQQRLQQVEPADLRKILIKHFEDLRKSSPAHQSCHLFKWKTPASGWKLVWCWGFQRKDLEPAQPVICSNGECRLLFVKRSDNPDCPKCSHASRKEPSEKGGRKGLLITAVAFVAVAVALTLLLWPGAFQIPPKEAGPDQAEERHPPLKPLSAHPEQWQGPLGGRIEFTVKRTTADGTEEDVTRQVVARSDNPKVAFFDRAGIAALARSPGTSVLTFHLGRETAQATVTVEPPRNPAKIVLEPKELMLGVGTTTRLQVIGEYEGGAKIDLTEAAQWLPADNRSVFVQRGVVEGRNLGIAVVRALYRSAPDQPLLDAEASVSVKNERYASLQLALDRDSLIPGQSSGFDVTVKTGAGGTYSIADSSQLKLTVSPAHVARLEQGGVQAIRPGEAEIQAVFRGLTAGAKFVVADEDTPNALEVRPKSLHLAVAEIVELEVSGAPNMPIELVSSAPNIAEIQAPLHVIGRAAGKATIVASQGGKRVEVYVDVARESFQAIAVVPERISVAVDQTLALRIVGRRADGMEADLAPDQVRAERLPSPTFVDFDPSKLTLRGVQTTANAPQKMTLRYGELKAAATIDVIAAPLRLEVTPPGPIALPVGQSVPLQVWADYGPNRRVQIPPGRVEWHISPEAMDGLQFDRSSASVRAHKESAAPLTIVANYQGQAAEPVTVEAIEGPPLTLVLADNRTPLVVGESGQLQTLLVDAAQRQTAAEGTLYVSTDAAKLAVNRHTGTYRALAAGEVRVAAKHPAAAATAVQDLQVIERSEGTLELRPATVRLPVGGRAKMDLVLVNGGGERQISLAANPDVRLTNGGREAVRWEAPMLIGVRTQGPFEWAATWQGKTGRATVEVLAGDDQRPAEIRAVPSEAELAPGQTLSPRIEQKLPGDPETWSEIQPDLVRWSVPEKEVIWTPASGGLPPRLTLAETGPEQVKVQASLQGGTTELTVRRKAPEQVPKADAPDVNLAVAREPEGETLAVDQQQQYTILVEKDGVQQPAIHVQWPPAFENEFVTWRPPVLRARRPGHTQQLSATVDGREIPFQTRIVAPPPAPTSDLPPSAEPPQVVQIASDLGSRVTIPRGAEFSNLRVEAGSAAGPMRDVTRRARLFVEGDQQTAAVAVSGGNVRGIRAGQSVVQAEYQGIQSVEGVIIEVAEEGDITGLEIQPARLELGQGETVEVRALGFSGQGDQRTPLGDLTSRGDLVWESQNPEILRAAGPSITAVQAGRATLLAKLGDVTATAEISIEPAADGMAATITVAPASLQLRVGESQSVGADISVQRGGADVTRDVGITSSRPDVVKVDLARGSVTGVSPGEAELALTYGGQNRILPVTVEPAEERAGDVQVVVEPSSSALAVGEPENVRVYLVGVAGDKTDRTGSAVLESSDPEVLAIQGMQVVGKKAGEATVTAQLPESSQPGEAHFTVQQQAFTELTVVPSELKLATGEEKQLRIHGVSPEGRRELVEHPDLTFEVKKDSEAIALTGATVRAAAAGKATIEVRLGASLRKQVAVEVSDQPWSELRIEPQQATLAEGEQTAFLVFAKRGLNERALTAEDGVQFGLSNTSAARVREGFAVAGTSPGFTTVTARLGALQAEAKLTVTAADRPEPPPAPPSVPLGLRFVPDLLSLQLGTPGASVRVVKVLDGGREEDVDHRTIMTFDGPSDVAEMTWTASGPVFKPLKLGTTRVSAAYEGHTTRSPLMIEVVDVPEDVRLDVRPNPIILNVEETKEFQQARILFGRGGTPVAVDYRVESADAAIVAVDNGRTMRGAGPGETRVKVTPVGVDAKFANLSVTVSVQVNASEGADPQARLVLSGPSQTTLGATAEFTVQLVGDAGARDVTSDGANLVLDRESAHSGLAEILPGGRLVSKKKGVANVKARYQDLISDPVMLRIDPAAGKFDRLEIEIDQKPLAVGQRRPYRLWGHPLGGGPKQDLTNSVTTEAGETGKFRVALRAAPGSNGEVAAHEPPMVIGKSPGNCHMAAMQGELRSEVVELEVVDGVLQGLALVAEPATISVRVGQPAPPVRVLAREPGAPTARQVDVELESQDLAILAPSPSVPGQWVGQAVGRTQLVAALGNQRVSVDVVVITDPFQNVTIGDASWSDFGTFSVPITVQGTVVDDMEYRVLTANSPSEDGWKPIPRTQHGVEIELQSPSLPMGPENLVYHLILEARTKGSDKMQRYPCSFRLKLKTNGVN